MAADISTATLTLTANSRNRRPTMPRIMSRGMNTAISEIVIETTVNRFQRRGDGSRHGLGARAGQGGRNLDGRIVYLRQGGDRQQRIADQAEPGQARHEQRRRNRAPNERRGEIHAAVTAARRAMQSIESPWFDWIRQSRRYSLRQN